MFRIVKAAEQNKILHTGKVTNGVPEVTRLSLSPSKLITWDECKAKFRAVMLKESRDPGSIYTAIGTAAHYVVEQINKGELLSESAREELFRMKLIEECAAGDFALNFPAGYKESLVVVKKYKIPDGWNLVRAEALQQIEFVNFTFRYIVDAIFISDDGKTLYIVDYKTSAAVPKSPLQLMAYSWATAVQKPEIMEYTVKAAYHMLRKDSLHFHDATRETIEGFDAWLEKQVSLIEQCFRLGHHPTTPGAPCHFCALFTCPDRDGEDDRGTK